MSEHNQFDDFVLALDGFAIYRFGIGYLQAPDMEAAIAPALDPDRTRAYAAFRRGDHPRDLLDVLAPEAGLAAERRHQNALNLRIMAHAREAAGWQPVQGGYAVLTGARADGPRVRLSAVTQPGRRPSEHADVFVVEAAPRIDCPLHVVARPRGDLLRAFKTARACFEARAAKS